MLSLPTHNGQIDVKLLSALGLAKSVGRLARSFAMTTHLLSKLSFLSSLCVMVFQRQRLHEAF